MSTVFFDTNSFQQSIPKDLQNLWLCELGEKMDKVLTLGWDYSSCSLTKLSKVKRL